MDRLVYVLHGLHRLCRRTSHVAVWALGLGLVWSTCILQTGYAQEFGRIEDTRSNVAYFYHARPGEATVQVSVWGTVPRPGIYEIPDSTDLDKLLTMAGGAPVEPRQAGKDAPEVTVRLYRDENGERTLVLETRLERMLRSEVTYPLLRDDDIIVVETIRPRDRFGWRDGLSLITTLGTLTLVFFRISDRL